MHYYGTRLSENLSLRQPEGYLLCLNVPVARTGTQEYLTQELGLPPASGPGGSDTVPVLRPGEEVFSPEAVASFEGMPVTNDHPPDGVDAGNIRALQKGHAHHVRRGTGAEKDLLLADLIITDPALIDAVLKEGKREISCGYTYELCLENGRYVQRRIRGNHVAVVDAGRAGPRVSIRDRRPANHPKSETERRNTIMKKSLTKVLARMAKDGDIETVAEIIGEMLDPVETAAETAAEAVSGAAEALAEAAGTAGAPEQPETQPEAADEDGFAAVCERLDRIIELLQPAAADEEPGAAGGENLAEAVGEAVVEAVLEGGDPAAGEIAAAMEEILEPDFTTAVGAVTEDEDGDEPLPEVLETGDALRAALRAVRPALARMPKNQRRRVAGDIAARLRGAQPAKAAPGGAYAALASARRGAPAAAADLGRRIMEKRNPHYRH